MFSNSFQSGFMSIFFSVGSNPLDIWDKQVKNGHIRRIIDDEVKSLVLDIGGTNVATTYITCPIKARASLGIRLPYLVMIIKNMKKYFTFEIQILDDKDMRRRFRVSNFQSTTKVRPFCTTMPIGLSSGWNQVQFNLADFTKRAYGSTYIETVRVQVHANVRIRRIYFADRLLSDEELPNEFKLFAPGPGAQRHASRTPKRSSKEAVGKEQAHPPPIKKSLPKIPEVPPPPSPVEELPTVKERVEEPIEESIEKPIEEPVDSQTPDKQLGSPLEVEFSDAAEESKSHPVATDELQEEEYIPDTEEMEAGKVPETYKDEVEEPEVPLEQDVRLEEEEQFLLESPKEDYPEETEDLAQEVDALELPVPEEHEVFEETHAEQPETAIDAVPTETDITTAEADETLQSEPPTDVEIEEA
ncbi:variable charge X-linked protein 3B-like isoform X2 [Cylas formicarius]|uniref:variable charge X-linked protein 3B-like isoform X2 n=1 Tax=Cylas formicarius TaxID=197179 RepID=UPI00295892F8|nr:variable charge X-linked protein 3B-like isoform X2 [Cylas formicarius]